MQIFGFLLYFASEYFPIRTARYPLMSIPVKFTLTLSVAQAIPRLRRTHERVFLDAEMKTEVLGYQMSPKSGRESERLKCYSHAKLQL